MRNVCFSKKNGSDVDYTSTSLMLYLLVSLHLLYKRALLEQSLQALLSIVVAQLLKSGAALSQPRVLKTRSVHD